MVLRYESPADTAVQVQDFPLSKARLNKNSIVYSDEHRLCVRIKEKMVCLSCWRISTVLTFL